MNRKTFRLPGEQQQFQHTLMQNTFEVIHMWELYS